MAGALAGPRPYGFTQGTDTLPAGGLELENWFGADRQRGVKGTDWSWWLGPVAGFTDSVEAALFAVMDQAGPAAGAGGGRLALSALWLQLSYAFAEKAAWPVDLRLGAEVRQPVSASESYATWLYLIASRDVGRLNVTSNLGGYLELEDEVEPYLLYALASSFQVAAGLRVGGEAFGEAEEGRRELQAGPSLAYGRGRIWLSGTYGFGIGRSSALRRARLILAISL